MARKSMKVKIEEYKQRKAADKREREEQQYSRDYHPEHPDNR